MSETANPHANRHDKTQIRDGADATSDAEIPAVVFLRFLPAMSIFAFEDLKFQNSDPLGQYHILIAQA